jgi:SAM-dependent methyltransferase
MQPLYNAIGSTYGATRRADPAIVHALARLIEIGDNKQFLDLACGTGNYTSALASLGGHWHGIDISDVMIKQAREKNPRVTWQLGSADTIPYPNSFLDGAMCTLAIHHFPKLLGPFKEVYRVLSHGRFVIFTAFPEQMRGYWLCHYFPEMMRSLIEQEPTQELVETSLRSAGFEVEDIIPFYVTNELQDLFLYSGKQRPEQYFDPLVRANTSPFASRCSSEELQKGLQMLRADLESGEFENVARSYQSAKGDYAYVVASKHCR